ncbi:hypothetical protein BK635_04315 [Pseudomonas chlororaphis]|nr:hypothetical protein BK635_04315 [Pseudomonas chlororaphis]
MRSFRQIKVARFTTAARSIAAFGSGYKGAGDFNRYPPIAGCASGYRKRQSPVNRALAFFFALDL